ncbi:unnamed protein product [Aureobasidium pullulans]|nr:unnamed protein product [Aureobasidium pullulans]
MLEEWTAPSAKPSKPEAAAPSFLDNPTMPTSMPNSAEDQIEEEESRGIHDNDDDAKTEPRNGASEEKHDAKSDAVGKKAEEEHKMPKGLKQPPPEAFKEPDPNSLLDAFGF